MEMTTNNLGNLILPCAAEVIILQFRKFMGVLAYNLLYLNQFKSKFGYNEQYIIDGYLNVYKSNIIKMK